MYEVWEIATYPEGRIILRSAGNGYRKYGYDWIVDRHDEGVREEFRTASSPAAANMSAALNWLVEQGHTVITCVPAGMEFPSGTFWVVTTPKS